MTIAHGESGWCDYLGLMDAFADKVCDLYQPGDIVMIHDYPLMMLPQILRSRLPNIYLTFSLHANSPCYRLPSENLRPLFKVLQGALGSDIITFQAPTHFDEFINCCAQESIKWAPYQASLIAEVAKSCAVYPMAIDASRVISIAWSEAVSNICDYLRSSFKHKKIIVSYSAAGFSGETPYVTQAVDRLETLFPQWRGKVVLLQITSLPCSSTDPGASRPYVNLVHALTTQNNSSKSCTREFRGQLSEPEHYALLRASDTTIFPFAPEGLMKAALDFMLCQRGGNKRPVISEINPLRSQLPRAILFPRGDVDGIARALNHALECSDQQPTTPHKVLESLMIPSAEEADGAEMGPDNGGDGSDETESDDFGHYDGGWGDSSDSSNSSD
ncbi:glycosyltransferase family 20 protein [Trichoderma velutinum]